MTDVAAPRSINYTDTLPLAIASTQNRRSFYPQNGHIDAWSDGNATPHDR